MSSQNIWERRIIAGLLDIVDTDELHGSIEGLALTDEGLVFCHEPLSDVEIQRIDRALDTVRRRLQRRYDTLGGARSTGVESDDEALPDEDSEEEVTATGQSDEQPAPEPVEPEIQEPEPAPEPAAPAEQPADDKPSVQVDSRALAFLNG